MATNKKPETEAPKPDEAALAAEFRKGYQSAAAEFARCGNPTCDRPIAQNSEVYFFEGRVFERRFCMEIFRGLSRGEAAE